MKTKKAWKTNKICKEKPKNFFLKKFKSKKQIRKNKKTFKQQKIKK
jgi:hypothetical protein